MTQSNNDIEELEELLTELEGQEAQLVRPYSEDDDAVTQLMDAPLGDQEWMVQVTALDRRMMSTDQLLSELRAGKLSTRTLVWRGGMDDWLPIARVDGLSPGGASPSGMLPGGLAPSSAPGRLGAPAPLPTPPMWSTLPSAAPLPPPPAALAPQLSPGLPPAAAAPLPSPPSQPSQPRPVSASPPPASSQGMSSQSNTARPVAIDFSDMVEDTSSPLRGKRAVMALSAVAILAVFISVYALSSKGDGSASAAASASEQPHAVSALQPAPAEKKDEPMAAALTKPVEPSPTAAAASKPAESDLGASEASASAGSVARTTAPARYSPRSEYRRRSRGASADRTQDDSESSESPAAAVPTRAAPPSRATAAAEEEAPATEPAVAAGAADDADSAEPPKSTGKGSSTFSREAAKAALAEAATQAKNCRPAGGPSGTGRVEVHYEPSGKVSRVDILTGKFENTTTGSCVRMLFRRAKVPEFTGAPVVTVSKSFEIP